MSSLADDILADLDDLDDFNDDTRFTLQLLDFIFSFGLEAQLNGIALACTMVTTTDSSLSVSSQDSRIYST